MRHIVISGGGTGIGYACAEAFVNDGDRVTIIGRRKEVLESAAERLGWAAATGGQVRTLPADLTDPAAVERVAGAVDRVDVIVNNAGAGTSFGAKPTLTDVAGAWRREFDANVLTAVLLTTALLPRLTRPGGRVIAISSIAALRGGGGAYSAAKAALHGWALDLAGELGPDGVTVNVVAPGFVPDTEFFGDRMSDEGYAARVRLTLLGRPGTPAEIAGAVRYLASSAAGFVTGQILQVNGGAALGRG